MKFSIEKSRLIQALQSIQDSVPEESSVDSYSHCKIELKGNNLNINFTNYHSSSSLNISCDGEVDGEICLPLSTLVRIIKPISKNNKIEFSSNGLSIDILSGKMKFSMSGLNIPIKGLSLDGNNQIDVDVDKNNLLNCLSGVIFAAPPDSEIASGCSGIRVSIANGLFNVVALDKRVMARLCVEDFKASGDIDVTIHTSRCKNIINFLKNTNQERVKLNITDSKIRIISDNAQYTSILIGSKYPDWTILLNKGDSNLILNKESVFECINAASSISRDGSLVEISVSGNTAKVYSNSRKDSREFHSELDCRYSGKDFIIKISPSNFLRGQKLMSELEDIRLEFNYSEKISSPVKIYTKGDNFYLFMPSK